MTMKIMWNKYRKEARRIFLQNNPLPLPCEECGIIIKYLGNYRGWGNIHHRDENWKNNDLSNLSLLCVSCHQRYHRYFKMNPLKITVAVDENEYRENLSNSVKAFYSNPETYTQWYRKRFGKEPRTQRRKALNFTALDK